MAKWKWVEPDGINDDCYEGPLETLEDENGNEVCYFGDCTQYYPSSGRAPAGPDRPLIEAAPELLDALKAFPGFTDDATVGDNWIEQMRAAIAKAEGK